MAEPLVALGEIATTHGLDGRLKLNPFNLDSRTLVAGCVVHLETGDAQGEFELAGDARLIKNQFLIKLRGIERIEDAQRWIGATLSVAESALEPLEPGQYYHYQVIGFEVRHKDGSHIGIVDSLLATAGGDILVVKEGGKEYLIPAVKEMVETVDMENRQLIVDPPEGLLDL